MENVKKNYHNNLDCHGNLSCNFVELEKKIPTYESIKQSQQSQLTNTCKNIRYAYRI